MAQYAIRYIKSQKNLKGILPDGIAGNRGFKGETIDLIQKGFYTSNDNIFHHAIKMIYKIVDNKFIERTLNQLLVIIKQNGESTIYTSFPVIAKVRFKTDQSKKKGDYILSSEVLDIESITFSSDNHSVTIENGDKIIWVFRENWMFGLYFDLSGQLDPKLLNTELGACFRYLRFYHEMQFFNRRKNNNIAFNQGWFPFIELIRNSDFEKIMSIIDERKNRRTRFIKNIVNKYTKERIDEICNYWWNNKIFNDRKEILLAGIDSYFHENGYINTIKTLSTEIEGIITAAMSIDTSVKTDINFKEYIKEIAVRRSNNGVSILFPEYFSRYLNENIFCKFEKNISNKIVGRHAYAHGFASVKQYSKERALQMILTLDQIYYFIS